MASEVRTAFHGKWSHQINAHALVCFLDGVFWIYDPCSVILVLLVIVLVFVFVFMAMGRLGCDFRGHDIGYDRVRDR